MLAGPPKPSNDAWNCTLEHFSEPVVVATPVVPVTAVGAVGPLSGAAGRGLGVWGARQPPSADWRAGSVITGPGRADLGDRAGDPRARRTVVAVAGKKSACRPPWAGRDGGKPLLRTTRGRRRAAERRRSRQVSPADLPLECRGA